MPKLIELKIDDLLAALPPWESYAPAMSGGLFIGALGFEDRTLACFEKWRAVCDPTHSECLLIEYPTNKESNTTSVSAVIAAAKESGIKISVVKYERHSFYGRLSAYFDTCKGHPAISVDISSMASYVIYPLLAALTSAPLSPTLSIVYSEAAEYFPTQAEWEEFRSQVGGMTDLVEQAKLFESRHFQSKGVSEIYESPQFVGHNPDGLPTYLAVIPNFSYERVQKLLVRCDDKYSIGRDTQNVEWIVGTPPNALKNGWRAEAVGQMYDLSQGTHSASTFDYKEIIHVLHDIWMKNRYSGSLVVAPLGSKAQHWGTFLFARMHPEIAIVLSEPVTFTSDKFSKGVGPAWVCNPGTIGDLNSMLTRWNRYRFEWDSVL